MEVLNYIVQNGQTLIDGSLLVLGGLIVIAMVIPGDQPEKALQSVVEFLKKFSRKPE